MKVRPASEILTAAQLLDVFRVEQRLKYLGMPALGYGDPHNTAAENKLQNFEVDGKWEDKESYAAYAFYKVVTYGVNGRSLVDAGHGTNFVHGTYFGALRNAATHFTVDKTDTTMNYLNAYNAPHWMEIGTVLDHLGCLVQSLPAEYYNSYRKLSLRRISARDPDDWPIVACSLALNCPIWTEDTDFFGAGVATWTTNRVEYYLSE